MSQVWWSGFTRISHKGHDFLTRLIEIRAVVTRNNEANVKCVDKKRLVELIGGQGEAKGRALVEFAGRLDVAAMQVDDALGDG